MYPVSSMFFASYHLQKTHLQGLVLCNLETIRDNSRVQSFRDVAIRLLQKLTDQQNGRRRTITTDIVLGSRSSRNHDGGGVLYLHLPEENVSIFCQLDLFGAH